MMWSRPATIDATDPFRILVVCTGNICRSPQAERLLASEFTRRGLGAAIEASSAGVAALVGHPMDDRAAAHTLELGGDPRGHIARRLEAPMVERADLVLTMERGHRSEVVRTVARASRYTFTLPEFVRLVDDLRNSGEADDAVLATPVSERFRALVPQIAAGRGMLPPVDPSADEVVDPYRRADDVYARSALQVRAAVVALVEGLVALAGVSAVDS